MADQVIRLSGVNMGEALIDSTIVKSEEVWWSTCNLSRDAETECLLSKLLSRLQICKLQVQVRDPAYIYIIYDGE